MLRRDSVDAKHWELPYYTKVLYNSPYLICLGSCSYRNLGVGEGGVGTYIPLLRFIKGFFGLIKVLSREYGSQHPPPQQPPKSL